MNRLFNICIYIFFFTILSIFYYKFIDVEATNCHFLMIIFFIISNFYKITRKIISVILVTYTLNKYTRFIFIRFGVSASCFVTVESSNV